MEIPCERAIASAETDPRVYFAAERTLLAWVRTGVAMMGFGFVLARFGVFLREIAMVRGVELARGHGLSLRLGTTLVGLGVIVNLVAAIRHWRTIRRLQEGRPLEFRALSAGVIVSVVVAAIGLAMAVYLSHGIFAPAP